MAVVTGATIWLLISVALILNVINAPRRLIQAGLVILGVEFALLVIASSTAQCSGGPCFGEERLTEASGPAAAVVSYGTPALAVAFTLFAIGYGLRHHRRTSA